MKLEVALITERNRVLYFTFEGDTVTYGTPHAKRVESIAEWKARFPQYVETDGTIQFPPEMEPSFALTA